MVTVLKPVGLQASPRRGRRPASPRRRRELTAGYLLIIPAVVLFCVFVAIPLIGGIALSLFEWDLLTPAEFAGASNYRTLAGDPEALRALLTTLTFTIASVVLHVVLGLALAVAVNGRLPQILRYFLRTAFFFPVLISWAVVAIIAQFALDPNFGFITHYLGKVGVHNVDWFTNPDTALPALIGVDLWRSVGFTFIVLLAALQGVPRELHEAAQVDGAGGWRVFRSITLPLLSPAVFFVSVISFIGAFQVFEPMFIITNGGPGNATRSVVQYIYEVGFQQFRMGYAATLGLVVFAVILLVTCVQFLASRRLVHYDLD